MQPRRRVAPSTALLAPHASGPKDVPRCGALGLLQKTLHYRGDPSETAPGLNNAKFSILVVVVMVVVMSYSLLGPMPFSNLLNL